MPLALDCVCASSGAVTCQITQLIWVIESASSDLSAGTLKLRGGPVDVNLPSWAPQEIELAPALGTAAAWLALWDSLYFEFSAARSGASDDLETGHATYHVKAVFHCADEDSTVTTDQEQRSYNIDTQTDVCSPDGIVVNATGTVGTGGVSGYIRHTRPLDDCYGFLASGGNLQPKPLNTETVDLDASPPGSLYLCPSGGTAPYHFAITDGNLPGGMALDPITGQLTGTPDGSKRGSKTITFSVTDSSAEHAMASVTCALLEGCAITEAVPNVFY